MVWVIVISNLAATLESSINAGTVSGIGQKDVCSWLEWGCKRTVRQKKANLENVIGAKRNQPVELQFDADIEDGALG